MLFRSVRTFPANDARLRGPVRIADEEDFESGAGRWHVDFAARWSHVVGPLDIAIAPPLAEKLKSMVAPYGDVAAMEQQNALVITETAAQVRRLIKIVRELDREDPEGAVEIVPVRYAKASDGINWQPAEEPVLVAEEPWEASAVNAPSVLYDGETYHMWYDEIGRAHV